MKVALTENLHASQSHLFNELDHKEQCSQKFIRLHWPDCTLSRLKGAR